MPDEFTVSDLSRLSRKTDRGSHGRKAIYDILDASIVCHVAYVANGQPFATPTLFWRDGDELYWHGSKHGRMIRTLSQRQRVCVTVSHLDAFNLGRSGIASSVQYRSVMAFGTTEPITEATEKRKQMARLIDRKFSGRSGELRAIHDHEIDQITVIRMPIDEATAKVKADGVAERSEADYALPAWAGVIPVRTTIGPISPDHRLQGHSDVPDNVAPYAEGRPLEDALRQAAGQRSSDVDKP